MRKKYLFEAIIKQLNKEPKITMKKIIAVCGSNGDDETLTEQTLKMAEDVGFLIAKNGGILICGGLSGVMEFSAKGAKKAGGITVGILPGKKEDANNYIDVPIATNLGFSRNYMIINAADSIIAICGRWGTLNEVSFAITLGKKVILLSSSGGIASFFSKEDSLKILDRKPYTAKTPEEAVNLAFI
ncbi:MAG: TIGR00725 family protein [Candidatus Omnitrophica bacterium]|nr:TIGR00725 family protein [Candidatus Omnitrophota bacterium]